MRSRKKLYIIIVILIIAVVGVKYFETGRSIEIVHGSTNMVIADGWTELVSRTVNGGRLKLSVDGKEVRLDPDDIYMDENMNIMINEEAITSVFSCAVNRYYPGYTMIEKGNNAIIITAASDTVNVNGEEQIMVKPAVLHGSNMYIPLDVMSTYFSYEYNWNSMTYTAELINMKPDEKIYPYAYDYRKVGKGSAVKDQAEYGTCWAFASLTALESSLMPDGFYNFSEDHMTWHSGYNLNQNQGGEFNMSMAYLAAWKGPVYEEDDPYGDGYSPDGLEPAFHVQEMQIIESKNFDGIKKAVFLYGGVQSSLYLSVNDASGVGSSSYNSDTKSYCYIGTEKANHDIVIVGWDDSYPASSFATEPDGDGAFLCMNSWGENFGDKGYFYVSYYDSNIGVHNVVYTDIENKNNYNNIYQSDLCGWVGQLGYNREYAYFANAYEAKTDETFEAAGFYATGADTEYEMFFVEDFENDSSFINRIPVAKGSFANPGYYTVKADKPIPMKKGHKYAVVVYIKTPNSIHPIAIEYRADDATATVDLTDGEGYISLKGSRWEHVEETQNCNICLKMYTNNIEEQGEEK